MNAYWRYLIPGLLGTFVLWTCQAPVMAAERQITVESAEQLYAAINEANRQGGNTTIQLRSGLYSITKPILINASHITLQSESLNPADVVLRGPGMKQTSAVFSLFRINASHFSFIGITAEQAPNHIIQVAGENNADYVYLSRCILKDSFEQLLKVSHKPGYPEAADFGVVEHCTFAYSAGIGPQYYIGGIDLHLGQHWQIHNNQFYGIASPARRVAEHAIHLWYNSAHITVENNVIINSDRGIGYGMADKGNQGGTIKNNWIVHANNAHPYADAGITLESSPGTQVIGNWILQYHNYPNSIEYRFPATQNVVITNNYTNKRIRRRNGGGASVVSNHNTESLLPEQTLMLIERFPPDFRPAVRAALNTAVGNPIGDPVGNPVGDPVGNPVGNPD